MHVSVKESLKKLQTDYIDILYASTTKSSPIGDMHFWEQNALMQCIRYTGGILVQVSLK